MGGCNWPHLGETSLVHRGVLFLDELPEFGPCVLEVVRHPVEDKTVTISRAQDLLTLPANFPLIASTNPCPCGYYGDLLKPCACSQSAKRSIQVSLGRPWRVIPKPCPPLE